MIITRTPYRISFFGGGTDYPVWYREHGGEVLATTIDKYCYVTCRYLPPFFDFRHRVVWSRIELAKDVQDIQHPSVRSALRFLEINRGVEIHHVGDLPARTGIGSSSSFTVGLLHALHALKGKMATRRQLALEAIHVEQTLNQENIGAQDQTCAAFGGLNHIQFGGEDHIDVRPLTLKPERIRALESHLALFFTGLHRTASEIAEEQIRNTASKARELRDMQALVNAAIESLAGNEPIERFGQLLHENWLIKRGLTGQITNTQIDEIYEAGRSAGAIGGKLLGAGGGGFMLFFAPPAAHARIQERLNKLLHVPFRFEETGSQVVFYKPDWQENGA